MKKLNINKMTIKQLIKLEDKAKEVWVISPELHFDTENKDFSELVSVNLGEKTKYRYIVPATAKIEKNLKTYISKYKLSAKEVKEYFLFLPESEFNPFITETAIYNASSTKDRVACAAPATEDNNLVIRYNDKTTRAMASKFKALWKRYKRCNP